MLTVFDRSTDFKRRNFLQVGTSALAGLGLSRLFGGHAAHATAASQLAANPAVSGKSVVFLFLHGGPSQIETFDPKMTAPSGIRSVNGEVQSAIPGVTFGSALPELARRAQQMSIVRSFTTGDSRHDIKPIVSKHTIDANLGSLFSRVVGANDRRNGMPTNALLLPRAVAPKAQAGVTQFGKFDSTGGVGSGFAPFVPGAGGDMQQNMELHLPMGRLDDRRLLLKQLDRLQRTTDAHGTPINLDSLRQQAFETILGGAADAFDLSKEDPAVVAKYDTAPLVTPESIDRKWNNYNNYCDNSNSLGKLMLLARRLCERGCGFVTVTTNFVWDMHSDRNNAGVEEGMRYMGRPLDHAVSAFIDDLAERGLTDKILLVVCGEMGRTPRINKNGGRDHWGNLAPLMLSGGGLNMGHVIGQSSNDAGEPATSPVTIPHLVSTILQTLFDVGQLRLQPGVPQDILRLASGSPAIPGLL